ncbi:MAG: hypothetical protein ACE5HV_12700 [Acidobacteriota bacterium]
MSGIHRMLFSGSCARERVVRAGWPLRIGLGTVAPLALACSAGAGSPPVGPALAGETTAFVHVNVVPMDREQLLEDQTVVVNGGASWPWARPPRPPSRRGRWRLTVPATT